MRISVVLLMMSFSGSVLCRPGEVRLTACLPFSTEVPYVTLKMAETYAARIYQNIDVDLLWKDRCKDAEVNAPGTARSPNLHTLGMEWAAHAPTQLHSRVRASSWLFQTTGIRVVLYLDRILPLLRQDPHKAEAILGHILAHEIGHVLLQREEHSKEGLMKRTWSTDDENRLRLRLLAFEEDEAVVIRWRLRQCSNATDTQIGSARPAPVSTIR